VTADNRSRQSQPKRYPGSTGTRIQQDEPVFIVSRKNAPGCSRNGVASRPSTRLSGKGNVAVTAPARQSSLTHASVKDGWIDVNGHVNIIYYTVMFKEHLDHLVEVLGLGDSYRRESGCGIVIVESHITYERELLSGDEVQVVGHVLGADDKRLRIACEMHRVRGGERIALFETLFVNIDFARRRSAPFGPETQSRLATFTGPAPAGAGRVGLRRKV
jgi:acyl-CoA thioesterase FadM